jgi:hypothetical protein
MASLADYFKLKYLTIKLFTAPDPPPSSQAPDVYYGFGEQRFFPLEPLA